MTSAGSVRFALRSATEEVHERLHVARPFRDIAEGRLPLSGYGRLLASLHSFHAQLEAACDGAWAGAPRSAGRVARLESDLGHLGEAAPPVPDGWSPPARDGAALGCLYVAQGSTLGGRVVHRQLDYLLDGAPGRRFFAGSDADAATWRDLCGHLEREGRGAGRLDGMIAGASAAFALFEQCLERQEEECLHG
ncbi:biliverdin-producing heme oxygenase [Sphingomonas parva]|uniref:biliverdin-producing heme oxygenase n=1 Tax=Sphingomonas parva TaxID=2555898 RepID=UPI001430179C|nr:biliverdin-producing heme oxygenase [Sphingomonas parva]